MSDPGSPPSIPTEYQIYNSYAVDPLYQAYFTYAWLGAIGLGVVLGLPGWIGRWRAGGISRGWITWIGGIEERLGEGDEQEGEEYRARLLEKVHQEGPDLTTPPASPRTTRIRIHLLSRLSSILHPSLPFWIPKITFPPSSTHAFRRPTLSWRKSYTTVTLGQAIVLGVYTAVVLVCLLREAELGTNGNRAGFIALAQLTPIFLCSLPTSPLLYLLPPFPPSTRSQHRLSHPSPSPPRTHPSHLTLTPIHAYLSRTLFLLATIHGSLWIAQFRFYGESDQLQTDKVKRGLVAWGFLLAVVGSSLGMVKRRWYGVFWVMHLLCITGFFASVSYHTPYSKPWIWPPIALFAWDLAVRAVRLRIKEGVVVPLGGAGAGWTMIRIPHCDSGWRPTQHVNLRILHGGVTGSSVFSSHPFTITTGSSTSLERDSATRGLTLYAKSVGGWTKGLHRGASEGDVDVVEDGDSFDEEDDSYELRRSPGGGDEVTTAKGQHTGASVTVLIDGPYGGIRLEVDDYSDVLVFAGGSGITFAIACVEECLGRKASLSHGQGVQRIRVVWILREMGSIEALAPTLAGLSHRVQRSSNVRLAVDVHLTRSAAVVGTIELPLLLRQSGFDLVPGRPVVGNVIKAATMLNGRVDRGEEAGPLEEEIVSGLAVIACGPRTLVTESRNAVAGLAVGDRIRCGGVDFHGEGYSA